MNIEEAIKRVQEIKKEYATMDGLKDYVIAIETLLTAYEKQQKEIEELKQIKCKLDEKNIPVETLLAEFERLEDLEDDLTTVYLNGVYDGEKKVEDKIKAKIEEINKEMLNEENSLELFYRKKYCKEVLQSLLEKE